MIPPVPHVGAMTAYALADQTAPKGRRLISLSQNESLRPPSPLAVEAAARAAQDQQLYPDPDWTELRAGIAALHGIDPKGIVCGNGSLDLIGCLARAYLTYGLSALAPAHAYPYFRTAVLATGARFDTAPADGVTVDVDQLLAAARPDTRIVFVANPGNPTGTRIPRAELLRLRRDLPESVLLVIDEAYGEFADELGERHFDLVARGDTVVLRTFSKAYGLAGARVGWGLFPPAIATEIRKLLNPNNVGAPAQAAAVAALGDQAYMQETCRMIREAGEAFCAETRALGLDVPASFTNFALLRFASAEAAQAADLYLRGHGIFLRPQGAVGLPDCLRATISVADDMAEAVRCLKDWHEREGNR